MGESPEQRPSAAVSLAVTTVVACGALLWSGAAAGTDGDPKQVRLGADVSQDREFASLDEVEAEMDVDCPDLPSSPPPNGLVLCASVQVPGGEPRVVPGGADPLTEVLVAQGYCAVAPLAWDPDADAEPSPEGCLPSSVPLDLSGVSEDDRIMIENLLSVPDPEFTIAP